MGLDFGGGSVRALLLDLDRGSVLAARERCPFAAEAEAPQSSVVDPELAWQALCRASRAVLALAGSDGSKVVAIGATSMRHGTALLREDGSLELLATNRDARGMAEAIRLATRGLEINAHSGRWPSPVQPAARLLWLAEHAPERYARARWHLSISDWIAHRLCGSIATDASHASETLALGLEKRSFDASWISGLGLRPELFPELVAPGSRIGELREREAQELGLPARIAVAQTGGDTQCGLLGSGAREAGDLGFVLGTSTPVQLVLERPAIHPEGRLWSSAYLLARQWCVEANAGGVGEAVSWFAQLLFPGHIHGELALLDAAAAAPAGAGGVLSTFGVDVMDGRQLRLPRGQLGLSFLNAPGAADRKPHAARALLEGIALGLRADLELIEGAAGRGPSRIVAGGGLSRSALFTQLLADALGAPVEVAASPEATALGAALCAAVAAGVQPDLATASRSLLRPARRHEPDPARAKLYAELLPHWKAVHENELRADSAATAYALHGLIASQAQRAASAGPVFRPRILVTADLDESALASLRALGEVDYQSYRAMRRMLRGDALLEALRGYHAIVTEIDVLDAKTLLASPDLRFAAICRGDAVNCDVPACTALGIPVIHTPGRNADAVADLAVGFMLMLLRRLPEATRYLRETPHQAGDMSAVGRAFGQLRGRELWRKTIGLVGLGAVGRKVVERVRPFGARCVAYDPFLDPDRVRLAGCEPLSLDELLAQSDVVSLHAAVSDASRGLIGAQQLARMKAGSVLVNTARAALIDEPALARALQEGPLAGAALDVFSAEPPGSDHALLALPNLICAPHIGGNTEEIGAHQGAIVAEQLAAALAGERPRHLLNPEIWPDFDWRAPRRALSAEAAAMLGQGKAPAITDLERDKPKR
jgi:autoinducer 2 (AI-2) kinase